MKQRFESFENSDHKRMMGLLNSIVDYLPNEGFRFEDVEEGLNEGMVHGEIGLLEIFEDSVDSRVKQSRVNYKEGELKELVRLGFLDYDDQTKEYSVTPTGKITVDRIDI